MLNCCEMSLSGRLHSVSLRTCIVSVIVLSDLPIISHLGVGLHVFRSAFHQVQDLSHKKHVEKTKARMKQRSGQLHFWYPYLQSLLVVRAVDEQRMNCCKLWENAGEETTQRQHTLPYTKTLVTTNTYYNYPWALSVFCEANCMQPIGQGQGCCAHSKRCSFWVVPVEQTFWTHIILSFKRPLDNNYFFMCFLFSRPYIAVGSISKQVLGRKCRQEQASQQEELHGLDCNSKLSQNLPTQGYTHTQTQTQTQRHRHTHARAHAHTHTCMVPSSVSVPPHPNGLVPPHPLPH